jgi:hypothetical protein
MFCESLAAMFAIASAPHCWPSSVDEVSIFTNPEIAPGCMAIVCCTHTHTHKRIRISYGKQGFISMGCTLTHTSVSEYLTVNKDSYQWAAHSHTQAYQNILR